jgi:hypothetical protein
LKMNLRIVLLQKVISYPFVLITEAKVKGQNVKDLRTRNIFRKRR